MKTESAPQAVFSLSVDDGHPSDLRLAALLQRHGLRATFYVPVRNCEGPPVMTALALRELDTAFEIGSHTLEHRFLAGLDLHTALLQIGDGKAALEDILGHTVQGFCYPGGKYHPVHCQMVRSAGFNYARSTQNLRMDVGSQPFEIPTTLQFFPHARAVMLRNFLSHRKWTKRHTLLTALWQEPDWLKRIVHVFDHVVQHAGQFHLWCHALDLDRQGLWPDLDYFLGLVVDHIPAQQRLDNAQLVTRHCQGRLLQQRAA